MIRPVQATAANDFQADVYVSLDITTERVLEARYFAVPGFESSGGRQLAELVVNELPATPGWAIGTVRGMRLPILRETRAPAVVVKLGNAARQVPEVGLVIASLHRALESWSSRPLLSAEVRLIAVARHRRQLSRVDLTVLLILHFTVGFPTDLSPPCGQSKRPSNPPSSGPRVSRR